MDTSMCFHIYKFVEMIQFHLIIIPQTLVKVCSLNSESNYREASNSFDKFLELSMIIRIANENLWQTRNFKVSSTITKNNKILYNYVNE